MRTLAPWGGELRREMERFFDRFGEPVWEADATMAAGAWAPRMDVSETKDAVIVTAELPGVDADEIGLMLTGDLLILRGEKEKRTEERRNATTAPNGPTARFSAASDCRWRWTVARSPRRSRMVCSS